MNGDVRRGSGAIAVGLSGGVDSAVAALLLSDRRQVLCVTMLLADEQGGARSCCSGDAVERARATATALGLPWHILDLRDEFRDAVVDPFVAQYAAGETPNPCVACNRFRLRRLLEWADGHGAASVATGHYARLDRHGAEARLRRAAERGKDQSYMLWRVDQDVLAAMILPLGDLSKREVRGLARAADLPVADEPESQEVCFAPHGYRAALEQRGVAAAPGDVVGADGEVLGRHLGQWRYTIGQRRGLGVAWDEPLFVLERRPETNEVVVGPRQALETRVVWLREVVDLGVTGAGELSVQLRYRAGAVRVAAVDSAGPNGLRITLAEPFEAAAPGQSAVLYDNETVVGGGAITGQGSCDSLRRVLSPRRPQAMHTGGDSWMGS